MSSLNATARSIFSDEWGLIKGFFAFYLSFFFLHFLLKLLIYLQEHIHRYTICGQDMIL